MSASDLPERVTRLETRMDGVVEAIKNDRDDRKESETKIFTKLDLVMEKQTKLSKPIWMAAGAICVLEGALKLYEAFKH